MLRKIYKILPLFIVQWIASKKCEVVRQGKSEFYAAFNDTLFKLKEK